MEVEGGVNMDPGAEEQGRLFDQTELKIVKPGEEVIIPEERNERGQGQPDARDKEASEE